MLQTCPLLVSTVDLIKTTHVSIVHWVDIVAIVALHSSQLTCWSYERWRKVTVLKTALSFTQQYSLKVKQNPAKSPIGPKLGVRAITGLVGHRLESQTDSRTKQLHKNFKLNLKLKPQLRSTTNCPHITEWYKSRSQQEVKETSVVRINECQFSSPISCS